RRGRVPRVRDRDRAAAGGAREDAAGLGAEVADREVARIVLGAARGRGQVEAEAVDQPAGDGELLERLAPGDRADGDHELARRDLESGQSERQVVARGVGRVAAGVVLEAVA